MVRDCVGLFRFLDIRRNPPDAVKAAPAAFLNAPLTTRTVPFRGYEEGFCGRYLYRRSGRAVRADTLVGCGSVPPGRCGMNAMYLIGALLALGLCVYLLYAMFKPEKF